MSKLHRTLAGAAALLVALVAGTGVASAKPLSHTGFETRSVSPAGSVPLRTAPLVTSGRLIYHGGPVMRTNKTYAIYWVPRGRSVIAGYRSIINRYLHDVAADSGGSQNVYSTLTQYSDSTGLIAYSQTFGGSTTAKTAFPSNGCPTYSGLKVCLTDAQVVAEVRAVIAAKGWTAGPTHAFFLFLPKSVGTCDDPSGSSCAFTSYCAYHSVSGSGPSRVVYANVPYADTDPAVCGAGARPNNSDADDTINLASHEHREMIEDLDGDGWYDSAGNEGADKCAWKFGTPLGSTASGEYNQAINGHFYFIQEEWTNARMTCVQRGY
jgi:hypothetical protein